MVDGRIIPTTLVQTPVQRGFGRKGDHSLAVRANGTGESKEHSRTVRRIDGRVETRQLRGTTIFKEYWFYPQQR